MASTDLVAVESVGRSEFYAKAPSVGNAYMTARIIAISAFDICGCVETNPFAEIY